MTRYTMDIGEKFESLLSCLAADKQTTKAEVIRCSVALYSFLSKEVGAGRKVSITDSAYTFIKDVVLP